MAAKKKGTEERKAPGSSFDPGTGSLKDAAEKTLAQFPASLPLLTKLPPEEIIHELQVHQIELEMQGEELRRAQVALEDSRDQYLDLYEFAPLGYLTLTETALVSQANLTAGVLFGIERSRMIKARFRTWVDPVYLELWDHYFTGLLQSENKETVTLVLKRGDGTTFPARLESIRAAGSNGQSVRMTISDISDIRKAEQEIRLGEDRIRLQSRMLDTVGDAVIAVDLEQRVTYWNKAAENIYGISAGEALGKPLGELYKAEWLSPENEKDAHRTIRDTGSWFGGNIHRTRDGVTIPVESTVTQLRDDDSQPTGLLAVIRDISERRQKEEMLQESEHKFETMFQTMPVGISLADTANGKLRDVNPKWLEIMGYSRKEEVIGNTPRELGLVPEPEQREHILDEFRQQGAVRNAEQAMCNKAGEKLTIRLNIEPIEIQGHTFMLSTNEDITESKRAQEALQNNKESLLRAHELLEAVTSGTDVIIAVQDTELRYIFFNRTYREEIKRLTGKDLTLGASMVELFEGIPHEQKTAVREWRKVLAGENVNQVLEFTYPDQPPKIYHVLHTPIRDPEGTIIAAGEVAFDVTKQIHVENQLRETKEYLDNLITYANAPIIVWDEKFHVTLFNHAFEHLTGRQAKDVLGKHFRVLLPEKSVNDAMDLIKKTLVGERWESVEIPILHKNGSIRTVLWNSANVFGSDGKTVVSTIAQGQDISDRKAIESDYRKRAIEYADMNLQLEEEIKQRRLSDLSLKNTLSLLNASLESTADGIYVIDRQGRITSFNQNFVNMWNIPPEVMESGDTETVMNHVLPQLTNPDEFLSAIGDLKANPGRESFDMIEFTDGKIFERYSKPQKIGVRIVGRVWSFRDITDRKRAEEKLVASIAEKEVLLREIHHRVKNNLQLISGLLDMTRMNSRDESTNEILTDMMLKIQTMAQIHTRLYESKQFGKINLSAQIRDQIDALSSIYSHKGHEISVEIHSEDVFLPVDQAIPCALIVNEILSNAFKHAFKGRKKGTIAISASRNKDLIGITIRDDGVGLPEKFDITHTNSLGIQLIRNLVEHQLRGSLTLKSRAAGTEFCMEFSATKMVG
jgi:PAS domain S-box-containing protein